MLLLAYKYADDLGEAITVNANLGGDNCHRGSLLGALLGAAGCELPAELREGLHDREATAAMTERYLGAVRARGPGSLVQALPPKPAAAVESEAAACST